MIFLGGQRSITKDTGKETPTRRGRLAKQSIYFSTRPAPSLSILNP